MKKSFFSSILPQGLQTVLFGDRNHGKKPADAHDPDWLAWQQAYLDFYMSTQKSGVGKCVNDAGYAVLGASDLEGKTCLEIGPGSLPHMQFWGANTPLRYDLADTNPELLALSKNRLQQRNIPCAIFMVKEVALDLPSASYDRIITFYSLEHVHPLEAHLAEYKRLLKPGGQLIGAIPAEGGLAWGLGRACTSRRLARKRYAFNFDKITAWEHCNTAVEVISACNSMFNPHLIRYWPINLPLIDINLVVSFRYIA